MSIYQAFSQQASLLAKNGNEKDHQHDIKEDSLSFSLSLSSSPHTHTHSYVNKCVTFSTCIDNKLLQKPNNLSVIR